MNDVRIVITDPYNPANRGGGKPRAKAMAFRDDLCIGSQWVRQSEQSHETMVRLLAKIGAKIIVAPRVKINPLTFID